jgi:CHAD domain-containing protein
VVLVDSRKRAAWDVQSYGEGQTRKLGEHLAAELHRTTESPDDPEAIHDLRIAIRRFKACLRAFGDRRATRKMGRRLRELIDLCGAARNCDIALELLAAVGAQEGGALQTRMQKERSRCERNLKSFLAKQGLSRALHTSPSVKDPSPPQTVPEKAKEWLPPLLNDFFERSKPAVTLGAKPRTIHKFRLQAKRFRYSLELFLPVYGVNGERGLKTLRGLLRRLGWINDCAATRRLLDDGACDAECREVLEKLGELQAERTAAFHNYWKLHFGPRREKWWITWLSRPINRRGSPPK